MRYNPYRKKEDDILSVDLNDLSSYRDFYVLFEPVLFTNFTKYLDLKIHRIDHNGAVTYTVMYETNTMDPRLGYMIFSPIEEDRFGVNPPSRIYVILEKSPKEIPWEKL